MKFIAWLVVGFMAIITPIVAYGQTPCSYYDQWKSEYSVEGPNHGDFVMLTNDRHSYIKESLFNLPRDVYFGPETLARMGVQYKLFREGYISCVR